MEPLSSHTVMVVGSVLLHFVWQGALVGIVVAALLAVVPPRAATLRYSLAGAGLLGMLLAPLVTLGLAWQAAPAGTAAFVPTAAAATQAVAAPGWPAGSLAGLLPGAAVLQAIVILWISGVAVLLARLALSWWQAERLRRRDLREPDGIVLALVERLRDRLGVTRAVAVFETPWVDTPTVVGWLRPALLLPIGAFTGLSMQQVEAILAHELAHVRRHDYCVNALQHLAETVFFYHPAVWWLSRQIRIEREHCCDDVAVDACGDPVGYARALAALEQGRLERVSLALGIGDGSLLARVNRLLGRPRHTGRPALPLLVGVAGLVACVAVATVGSAAAPALVQAPDQHVVESVEVAPVPAPRPAPSPGEAAGAIAPFERVDEQTIAMRQVAPEPAAPGVRIGGDVREPRKVVHVDPIYPDAAREAGISGVVILELQIEPDGSVSTIDVMRSIPALDQAAINAVRQWRYAPTLLDGEPVRVMMVVTVNFALAAPARSERLEALRVEPAAAEPDTVPRVGGSIREPRRIRSVPPVYPEAARAAGVSGVVIIQATIDAEGNVTNPRVQRSIPMLDQAALDAVRQWKYVPLVVDGRPSPVTMTMTVNFVNR